uniref:Nephrocystin 3-like N-terminal domain-containing protein n=1 Tax=Bionectria ochroleuca TaxID=29856 RepID=A0A0B7K028_BIOOC
MFGLMVGIGGGIPDNEDIRLGDIVVGTKIVQHDLGKTLGEGKVHRTGQPVLPSRALNTTVSNLRSKHELEPSRISVILEERMGKYSDYCRPKAPDRLFQREYQHVPGVFGSPCGGCDLSNILPRSPRPSDVPSIHYGGIASGNQVLRDATTRGMIGTELDVLCFEMEAAGFMHVLDCLCIRGICDYSDSHKSKAWQKYSAAVAAAYARELLENFPRSSRPPVYQLPIATIQNSARLNTDANILERESMVEILKYPQMDSRQDTIEAAEGHTCRWFLANSHYQAWLDPEQLKISHGFLWITGKPGAGKSVMMKFLSAEMREQGQQTHGVIISFFFSAQGSTLQKSVTGMYRSLLHQLFGAYWDLPDILDRPEFRSRTVDTHLALNNLKALFKAAVLKLDRRRLTCFIDALDECDEQQALEMIRFFEDLTNTSTKNDIPLRICFSSRPYPHMMIPTSILLTLEDQPDHAADMKSYISNNLRIEDPKLAEELKLRIMQKASGVFMWVVVVIPILNNDDRWGRPTIKRQLEELPDSLSNLYKDILTRDKTNPDDLLFSVLWVLYAKWPLTPEEYYHALWCGLKLRGRADAEIPDVSDTFVREKINRYIVTSSKGLVEVTKFRVPTVQFIHETVRDFLLKENGLEYILSHAGPKRNSICHDMLKQCCGVFLSLCLTLDINEGLRGSHPFRRYCSLNILHHANAAAEHIPQRSFLADLDLPILVQGLRLFQKPPRYTEAVSLTYILAREGLSKLIPTWLEICPNIHIYGEEYRHPLFAAVNESRHTTAALLGVAPGSPEYQLVKRMNASDIDDTPLSLACRLGDFGMVRLLLNSGDDPNHTNKQGSSLLWEALKGGHDSISALLIEGGADANRKFHLTNMYLGLASSKGYHATAKCLLERGAVVDSIAWSWQTPLLEASRNGHEDIAGQHWRQLLAEPPQTL